MFSVALDWSTFSTKAQNSETPIKYADKHGNYYLYLTVDEISYSCVLDKNDATDFEDNYKNDSTAII